MKKQFAKVAIAQHKTKWDNCISREEPLYQKADDIRSPFARDYTRILHSTAYRRLKHKTQARVCQEFCAFAH